MSSEKTAGTVDVASAEAVRRWREAAGREELVLLDGFHALKHAVRFGADVTVAVAEDRRALLELAGELAPDVRDALDGLVREAPLRELVARVHPTGVAALAVRPDREALLAALGRTPRSAPVVVLDNPATSATSARSSGSRRASAPPGW